MLALAVLAAFLLYGYFVQVTIHTIVERGKIAEDTKALTLALGELEAAYDAARRTITYDYAHERGFHEAQTQTFASRAQLAQGEVSRGF